MTIPTVARQRLRALRKERKMTLAQVGAAVGIGGSTLSGIELGHDDPGRATYAALAQFYDVSLDYLEGRSPAPGLDVPGESIKDASEASLVRFWRILERDQKDELMARIADMIGSRLPATPEPDNSPHRRTPLRANEP